MWQEAWSHLLSWLGLGLITALLPLAKLSVQQQAAGACLEKASGQRSQVSQALGRRAGVVPAGTQAPGLTDGACRAAPGAQDRGHRALRGWQGWPRSEGWGCRAGTRSKRDLRGWHRGLRRGRRGGPGCPRSEGRSGMGSSGWGLQD